MKKSKRMRVLDSEQAPMSNEETSYVFLVDQRCVRRKAVVWIIMMVLYNHGFVSHSERRVRERRCILRRRGGRRKGQEGHRQE